MATKKLKTLTTSARKKSSNGSREATSKASKTTVKSKAAKKKEQELKDRKELREFTLKLFQRTYDAYQQGKFHRLF